MTAIATAPATAPVVTTTPADRLRARAQRVRHGVRGTPGRMRLVSAGLVVVGLLVGVAAATSLRAADGALLRADANARQLVRLQQIQTSLVNADADATNAFLVGGLEPVAQRRDYDAAIEQALAQLAFAARAQPADGDALAALNTAVERYTSGVQQARAANRQGLPLGAQYLREAGAALRTTALPLLESLTSANAERVQTEFAGARRARVGLAVAGVLGLGLLLAALVWLARLTHRYVNVPLAAAGAVVLVVLVVGVVVLTAVATRVTQVRDGPYAQARALAQARVAAFDAKANESLTLVSRGSGAAFEKAWKTSAGTTTSALDRAVAAGTDPNDLVSGWAAYTGLHGAIRAKDDGGGWDDAVALATTRDAGSANATFASFDTRSATALADAGRSTTSGLDDARRGLAVGGWLGLLLGVLAAALAWWGLAQRIEEYR